MRIPFAGPSSLTASFFSHRLLAVLAAAVAAAVEQIIGNAKSQQATSEGPLVGWSPMPLLLCRPPSRGVGFGGDTFFLWCDACCLQRRIVVHTAAAVIFVVVVIVDDYSFVGSGDDVLPVCVARDALVGVSLGGGGDGAMRELLWLCIV